MQYSTDKNTIQKVEIQQNTGIFSFQVHPRQKSKGWAALTILNLVYGKEYMTENRI